MSWLTKRHNQKIVYWGSPVPDGVGGYTFADPIEVNGRWEDAQKLFRDASGNEVVSDSIVYLGQDVVNKGWLWLGEIADLNSSDQDNPELLSGAKEIRSFSKIPNLKADDYERMAFL
jgi:hypothetical protein